MNGSPVQNYYLDVNTTGGLINLNLCPCVCSWEWIVSCVLRCSWQTLPMCSCWSRVRMCPSCWRTSWRCAELCSASTATLLWSKAWTARPGQSHRTQQHWISIELCSALPAVHKHSAYCVHHIILGSSCCRCCWGSQKQWWRDHWRTKEKTCFAHSLASIFFKVSTNEQAKASYTPRYHPDVHILYRAFNWLKQTLFTSKDLCILTIRCI